MSQRLDWFKHNKKNTSYYRVSCISFTFLLKANRVTVLELVILMFYGFYREQFNK